MSIKESINSKPEILLGLRESCQPKVLEQVRRERIQKKIDDGQISGKITNRYGSTQLESDNVLESILKKLPKEAVILFIYIILGNLES